MAKTIAEIEKALEASGGFITQAANLLGVTHSAVSKRVSKSPRLRAKINEVKEECLDMAEVQLLKKIKAGDLGAICFFLKCKGKDRGYVEKQHIEHTGHKKGPIKSYSLSTEEYRNARAKMIEDDDC